MSLVKISNRVLLALSFAIFGGGSFVAHATDGVVVHAAEWGVGKFHRYDNQVHPYGNSAWAPYVLAPNSLTKGAQTTKNSDGSYTIFFSTLEELVNSVTNIADTNHVSISVFNIHGHGLPGQMWFPPNAKELDSWTCASWRQAADGSDQDNYGQYYSPVSVSDIETIRSISDNDNVRMPCTTGLTEWQDAVKKSPHFAQVFSSDAQIHFLSCVVGLGSVGEKFTKGIAQLLLPATGAGRVETSMNFGLGDWSMPQGMGFWDYQNQDQADRDNQNYTTHKRDLEIAQKGTIRVAAAAGGVWNTSLLSNRDYMALGFETSVQGTPVREVRNFRTYTSSAPKQVRVPGTSVYLPVQ